MVGAAVGIARIVITAVGGEGGLIARHDQAGLADGAIDLVDRRVARVHLDVPGIGRHDRAAAPLVIERAERYIAQPAREIAAHAEGIRTAVALHGDLVGPAFGNRRQIDPVDEIARRGVLADLSQCALGDRSAPSAILKTV